MKPKSAQYNQARNLYFQTALTQTEIARITEISEKTLYRWINEGEWKNIKASARHTPAILVEQFYTQLSAINLAISERDERPYPTKEEADIIRRLTLSIKTTKQGQTQSDNIQMMMHFIDQLQVDDPELAQQVTLHADKFITGKMQKGFNPWQIEYQSQREQLKEQFIEKEETAGQKRETTPTPKTRHKPDINNTQSHNGQPTQTPAAQPLIPPIPFTQIVHGKITPGPDKPPFTPPNLNGRETEQSALKTIISTPTPKHTYRPNTQEIFIFKKGRSQKW